MKKKAEEMKAKLKEIKVTETYKGITIDCNANKEILSIHIENELLNDKSKLESLITEAINNALSSAEKASVSELAGLAGGLGGLFK